MSGREIRTLTGLRGIAAVWVMIYHFTNSGTNGGPMIRTVFGHAYLAVDLFLVLSGYVLAINYADAFRVRMSVGRYKYFLIRRIARIYPLYAVTLLVALMMVAGGVLPPANAAQVFSNFFLIQQWGLAESINPPSWSISAELLAYLLCPFMLAFLVRGKLTNTLILTVASISAIVLASTLSGPVPDVGSPFPILRCLGAFSLGVCARRIHVWSGTPGIGKISTLLTGIVVILVTVASFDVAFILAMPFLMVALTSGDGLVARFLSWGPVHRVGVISYSIYLVHWLLSPLSEISQEYHRYMCVVVLILVFFVSELSYRFIEVPGQRLLRRNLLGRAGDAAMSYGR